jgi:hypothetical protein
MSLQSYSQGFAYAVDIVFCIDCTASMTPVLDQVKNSALSLHQKLQSSMDEKGKAITQLRVKVIAFRDFAADGADALEIGGFYTLPDQAGDFEKFVRPLGPRGGGDEPESGLEALALAIQSDWERGLDRRRHIIVMWTDASAHRIGSPEARAVSSYPTGIPTNDDDLFEMWGYEGSQTAVMEFSAKRLLLFAPDAYPWNLIPADWDNVIAVHSKAGNDVLEIELDEVIEAVANSV